ncbi:MAG: triacylglycerol lipase [Pseudomonadota bacterium]|nr:triacylglycerol lipase [Pseudomonadota bacterium]
MRAFRPFAAGRQLWRRAVLAATLVAAAGAAHAGYTSTRYPIVLMHGMTGFDRIGSVDYFYGIPQALRNDGAQVYVAEVSAFNSSEARGEQLLEQVRSIVALTGAQKVNLIGHSHGSHTVRYVASVAPELVASVTAVGGPNKGSEMADFIDTKVPDGSPLRPMVSSVVDTLGKLIGFFSGKPEYEENSLAGLRSLTSAGSAEFTAKFPQGMPTTACGDGPEIDNGVRYYSWTGDKVFTNPLDLVDWGMLALSPIFGGIKQDGLVSVCSSKLGKSLGVYSQNHLDEVNQLIGITDWFAVSPVTLYRQHANRLQGLGL